MSDEQLFDHKEYEPAFKPVLLDQMTAEQLSAMQVWLGGLTGDFEIHQAIDNMKPSEIYKEVDRIAVGGVAGFVANGDQTIVRSEILEAMDQAPEPGRYEAQPEIDF